VLLYGTSTGSNRGFIGLKIARVTGVVADRRVIANLFELTQFRVNLITRQRLHRLGKRKTRNKQRSCNDNNPIRKLHFHNTYLRICLAFYTARDVRW
jgi:hypothetical protein